MKYERLTLNCFVTSDVEHNLFFSSNCATVTTVKIPHFSLGECLQSASLQYKESNYV